MMPGPTDSEAARGNAEGRGGRSHRAPRETPGTGGPSESVALPRFLHRGRLDLAPPCQLRQRRDDDRLRVDAEVATGRLTGVGEAEAVGTERGVVLLDPLRD